jgi:hypothetical protein
MPTTPQIFIPSAGSDLIRVLKDFGHVVICRAEPLGQESYLPHQILAVQSTQFQTGRANPLDPGFSYLPPALI